MVPALRHGPSTHWKPGARSGSAARGSAAGRMSPVGGSGSAWPGANTAAPAAGPNSASDSGATQRSARALRRRAGARAAVGL